MDIYRKILGGEFDSLPESVRDAHSVPLRASGLADVSSGGWIAKAIARALGLPRAGVGIPLSLDVKSLGRRTVWERQFGDQRFVSWQWVDGSYMVEKYGSAHSHFSIRVSDGVVEYQTARVTVFGIPVPRFLAVTTEASVKELDEGFGASVVIRSALLGVLCHYEARMKFE